MADCDRTHARCRPLSPYRKLGLQPRLLDHASYAVSCPCLGVQARLPYAHVEALALGRSNAVACFNGPGVQVGTRPGVTGTQEARRADGSRLIADCLEVTTPATKSEYSTWARR